MNTFEKTIKDYLDKVAQGDDDFYALVMPTKTDIIDEARNQEWREINGEWYCPICVERLFNYDEDNDVYTRKESI